MRVCDFVRSGRGQVPIGGEPGAEPRAQLPNELGVGEYPVLVWVGTQLDQQVGVLEAQLGKPAIRGFAVSLAERERPVVNIQVSVSAESW
jgi:hypothetical protein